MIGKRIARTFVCHRAKRYYGGGAETIVNNQSTPLTSDFVSLHLKGRTDGFALKGGDATQGALKTMYDGSARKQVSHESRYKVSTPGSGRTRSWRAATSPRGATSRC